MNVKLNLQAPWTEYASEVTALFEKDPDVKVEYDNLGKKLKLYVKSPEKAEALEMILQDEIEFGSVKLTIEIIPANKETRTPMDIFAVAFKGNPIVSYTKTVDALGFSAGYVVFKPEVVQYFNDDLSDINGMKSTLYAEVAKDVFQDHDGVFFCTDIVD